MKNLENHVAATVTITILCLMAGIASVRAQTDLAPSSIVGSWTLNKAQSDSVAERLPERGDARRPGGGFGRGGGRGGGAFGGGVARGGRGARGNAEETTRRQEALRAILEAPERLTIVQTDSMVIVTTGDGRTTRLALDGTKIKDESTGVERKTKWEGGQLVTEITGSGPTMTEIYSADPAHRQLLVVVQVQGGGRDQPGRVLHRIYEAETRQ